MRIVTNPRNPRPHKGSRPLNAPPHAHQLRNSGFTNQPAYLDHADGYGRVTVEIAEFPVKLRVHRPYGSNGDPFVVPGCGVPQEYQRPEGEGVVVNVTARVVLPQILPRSERALEVAEQDALYWVNVARAKEGYGPVELSRTLQRAALGYNEVLHREGRWDHCTLGSPVIQAVDAGWPSLDAGQNLVKGNPDGKTAVELMLASPRHRNALLSVDADAIGIARIGDKWVFNIGECPPGSEAAERCEMTDQRGERLVGDGESGQDGADDPVAGRRLRIVRITRDGQRLRVELAAPPGVTPGRVSLIATRAGGGRPQRSPRRLGTRGVIRLRLRPGRWRLRATAPGADLRPSQTIRVRIR